MIERVAYLSMHTSPLLQPGAGDAGGMNVYIDGLARTMAGRGVAVDVYTRRTDPSQADEIEVIPGYRVFHVDAGPSEPMAIRPMAIYVTEFAEAVVARIDLDGRRPDIIHSHYWLSGWAGLLVKRKLGVPLANSFHTLGRVKDLFKREDEPPESLLRIAAEAEVIHNSECVVASTPLEAQDLLEHYGADPGRLCTSPPGVDHAVFAPGDRDGARARVGFGPPPVLLYAGRIQPLKGVDVALGAFALIREVIPEASFVVVGGPSGAQGAEELARLRTMASSIGNVEFRDPVPHDDLADHFRAADLLMLPSRSESFGLVAAEAQSCGLPVIAARTGGLEHVVNHGVSGLLVAGWDPADHAEAALSVLTDAVLSDRLQRGALEWSQRFSWKATADRFLELYSGVTDRVRQE
ncbi:MAG: glycosyltransferase [Acidimicrobiia bacterium]|nr:glycosyltransferase [Acidimicrobiia bacterium]